MDEKKRLIIIDSNSIIHRAYHALPPLTTKKGELVNAVYGFLLVFFKVIKEFRPDYIAACFDFPALTFRHKKFKEYKAKRPPVPEELYQQIPKLKEILKAFNVPIFEKEGFEADDIIGTVSKISSQKQIFPKIETIIISGDLDNLQLINSKTEVCTLRKGVKDTVLYDENLVKEKYQGLNPDQLVDFRALKGDPSDNIPGVKGIGEKTAIWLIREFKNIENLYGELEGKTEKIKKINTKIKETLLRYKKQVFFNRELATIHKDVPIDFDFQGLEWGKYNKKEALQALQKLGFKSLIKRISELEKENKENQKKEPIQENLKLW